MKYRVGDRVIIAAKLFGHPFELNEVVTIKSINLDREDYHAFSNSLNGHIREEECKPMKTEPNESGARDEYFGQLFNLFDAHIMAQDAIEENRIKERVLGISFDRVQELERRVEELETGIVEIQKNFNENGNMTGHLYEFCQNLLTPNK